MPPVKVLNPEVIAKIAAGEVIERPAAVVKELVENSLDAGADAIEVHLKDAGKELIHIKDNGHGIAPADLQNIFQRHATSKIKDIEDLEKISSMGFRGEALYSIAAVSDILLRSKIETTEAFEIHMQGGKRLDFKPAAFPGHGTEIKITQLFFNTPARRKFLKSSTAEMQQIINVFMPYTLLYPSKRFSLTHAGRSILDLRPSSSAIDRMANALNLESKSFIEASQDFSDLGAKVRMVLSTIDVQRPRRDLQFIFVNHRPVESKNLSFNINDIYRLILPPGVYSSFLIDIQIDPSEVDVNIHPTKREVRLRQEARIVSFVRHLVEYTLMQQGNAKTINEPVTLSPGQQQSSLTFPDFNSTEAKTSTLFPNRAGKDTSHWQSSSLPTMMEPPAIQNLFDHNDTLQNKFSRARYVGSFINKYLIFEADQSLFLVDQHAAQERIMFERFENQINEGKIEVQPLLTPILLKLTPSEKIAWEECAEKLKGLGLETTSFDDDTVAIQTQPVLLKNVEHALRVLLSGDDIARCDRTTIARRACKASIVTGDALDSVQADYQRKQLLSCRDPFTCPHGRPTVVELKESFLDKQFLRTS